MGYVIINNDVNIVFGEQGAVLNNVSKNKVYEIENYEKQILKELVSGVEIELLKTKYIDSKVSSLINNLIDNNCAIISDEYYISQPKYTGQYTPLGLKMSMYVHTLVIEVANDCDKGCNFCGKNLLFGCTTCKVNKGYDVDFDKLLSTASKIMPKRIIITGGDNFKNFNIIKNFIMNLKNNNCDVIIYNNIENIDSDIVDFLITNKIKLKLHLDLTVEKKNTEIKRIHNKCEYLKKMNNLLSLCVVVDKDNDISVLKELLGNDIAIEINYVIENLDELKNNSAYNNVLYCQDINTTNNLKKIHSCLAYKLAINSKMDVLPCLKLKNDVLVNLSDLKGDNLSLDTNELSSYWMDSLSEKDGCSKCQYKTYCYDCKAVETQLMGNAKYCKNERM